MDSVSQDSDSPLKQCKTCPRILPATTEYFHRDKHAPDKLCYSCKECVSARRKAYYYKNQEKAIAYSKQYVEEHREETAQYQKNYAEAHQAELAAYKKAYYAEHREEQLTHFKQWYAEHTQHASDYGKRDRKEHAEEKRDRDRNYRKTHAASIRHRDRRYKAKHKAKLIEQSKQYNAEHREEKRTYLKQYYQTERGIIAKRASAHNRRARRKKAKGRHTTEQLHQQLKRQEGRCYYCHIELPTGRNSWHADHIVPLSRGGSNDINNIVISCPPCNRKKHDKLPHEWGESCHSSDILARFCQ